MILHLPPTCLPCVQHTVGTLATKRPKPGTSTHVAAGPITVATAGERVAQRARAPIAPVSRSCAERVLERGQQAVLSLLCQSAPSDFETHDFASPSRRPRRHCPPARRARGRACAPCRRTRPPPGAARVCSSCLLWLMFWPRDFAFVLS